MCKKGTRKVRHLVKPITKSSRLLIPALYLLASPPYLLAGPADSGMRELQKSMGSQRPYSSSPATDAAKPASNLEPGKLNGLIKGSQVGRDAERGSDPGDGERRGGNPLDRNRTTGQSAQPNPDGSGSGLSGRQRQ